METTDPVPDPMFDDPAPTARPDHRRLLACFAACALAASAVFLVARTSGSDSGEGERAGAPAVAETPETGDKDSSEGEGEDRRRDEGDRGAAVASDHDNIICREMGDRLEGSGLCGTRWEPRSRDRGRHGADDGVGVAEAPAGWAHTSVRFEGSEGTITHPEDWDVYEGADQFQAAAADSSAGVGLIATEWIHWPWEELVAEYEDHMRRNVAADFEVIDEGALEFRGLEGYRIGHEHAAMEGETWWLVDGETLWILSYVHRPDDDEARRLAVEAIESFRLSAPA